MNESPKNIVVFGSSKPAQGCRDYELAYQVGQAIGQAGFVLANGGYGGTMAAAAQAADKIGALTIGVTCDAFGRSGPNQWIKKEIRTKNLNQRLETLINLADAYVLLPGSTGTLLELAMTWELINKNFLPYRPIIAITDYWKPAVETIVNSGELKRNPVSFVNTAEEMIKILTSFFADV